jgi:NAD(P)-dependent dehydrogenase (short-subunit alcohol dehydrogenase family)
MGRLTGKVALITGGSRGLGRETAILFAKEGAKVVIAGISDASHTLNAIKTADGEGMFVKADVSNTDEVQTMIQKTAEGI